ncbi:MAG TPA: hypothetical protein VG122_25375 [Gemmata sp.]|nr:hypothetical protein [Gemmata sp.]
MLCKSVSASDGKVLPTPDDKATPGKKGKGTFTIGKKTTYVTSPVDADGHIDYPAALNERLSKGITAENNAAVLLWKVIGPHPEKVTMPAKFYELLGVQISEDGDYFVPLRQYLETQVKAKPATIAASLDKLTRLAQRTWTAKEHPEIHDWLKSNDKPLALLAEATQRTQYYSPMVPQKKEKGSLGLLSTLLPSAQLSRQLASALVGRAMLRMGEDDIDAAWQDILACHRLGRLVGRGGSLIESLVGMSIEKIACQADLVFLDKINPDAKRIEACVRDLKGLPPPAEPADKVELCDRFTMLEHIMLIDKQGMWHLNPDGDDKTPNVFGELVLNGIDWDSALESINQRHDRMAAAMREKDRGERARKMDQIVVDIRTLKPKAADPGRLAEMLRDGMEPKKAKGQVIGDILITLMFPAAHLVQDGFDKTTQTFDNVIVAFALARYQRDNGKFPEKLGALAPKYLPQAPRDLFSGKAPIYRATGDGYLLYSVGVNGIDDGGRGTDDQPPGDDLVVRMPLPTPR